MRMCLTVGGMPQFNWQCFFFTAHEEVACSIVDGTLGWMEKGSSHHCYYDSTWIMYHRTMCLLLWNHLAMCRSFQKNFGITAGQWTLFLLHLFSESAKWPRIPNCGCQLGENTLRTLKCQSFSQEELLGLPCNKTHFSYSKNKVLFFFFFLPMRLT